MGEVKVTQVYIISLLIKKNNCHKQHLVNILNSPEELTKCLMIAKDAVLGFSLLTSNFWSRNPMTRSENVGAIHNKRMLINVQ